MTLRQPSDVEPSIPDYASVVAGSEGMPLLQCCDDQKPVFRPGATAANADFQLDGYDLIAEGDRIFNAEDIGGASLIVVSLNSNDGPFSVELDLKDRNDNVVRTYTPSMLSNQEEIESRTVPVAADNIDIRVTDESGLAQNQVDGSINIHSGGPSSVQVLDQTGDAVNPMTEDSSHRTGSDVDVNAATESLSLDVPGRPDSIRVLVTNAAGGFSVEVAFNNTAVTETGGSGTPVDIERTVNSPDTVDVTITDTSGAANTVDYDILLV